VRIAFDLDGVLADLHSPFVRMAARLFPELDPATLLSAEVGASPAPGAEVPPEGTAATPPRDVVVSPRQANAVWRAVAETEDFWESLEEIEPGAIARLAALADERRWELLFVTSRPASAGRTVQRQSQRWLERMGFPLPSVYVVQGSRGRIASALGIDVVVDDRPEHCLDVTANSKAGAVLVWRGEEGRVPASVRRLGMAVVPDVASCLDRLVEIDAAADNRPLLDRLRAVFGLRPRPADPQRR